MDTGEKLSGPRPMDSGYPSPRGIFTTPPSAEVLMRGGRLPRIASKDRERVAVSTTAQLGSHLSFQFGSDRFGYLLATSFLGPTLLAALSRYHRDRS